MYPGNTVFANLTIDSQCSLSSASIDIEDKAMQKFKAASAGYFMKKLESDVAAHSWMAFISHASLNVDWAPIIKIGSNESKVFVFVKLWAVLSIQRRF